MLNKTKIEWTDYTINPVKGLCPMACSYCYARRMYKRFKWNPEITYCDDIFMYGLGGKPGDKYFVGSTIELFGDWVEDWMMELVFDWVKSYPQRTFIFLTKLPENLSKWNPFPDNCWVGTSITHDGIGSKNYGCTGAIPSLEDVKAKVKFISFEPLLSPVRFKWYTGFVDWVIVGAQTPYNKKTAPQKEWVDEIVDAADEAHIPVFLKENLRPVLKAVYGDNLPMRQEFPKVNLSRLME